MDQYRWPLLCPFRQSLSVTAAATFDVHSNLDSKLRVNG
jgi:hypothetical protein